MAELGAEPQVPPWQARALKAVRGFFTPLLPDDYLELINPLWSTRELRGRVEKVEKETDETVTITIKPGWDWPGHFPGQVLRVGVIIEGCLHWRACSGASASGRGDGMISIPPKLVPDGTVSPYFNKKLRPG